MWEPPVLWNFKSRIIFLHQIVLILSLKQVNLPSEKNKENAKVTKNRIFPYSLVKNDLITF
jgi:hypothetical protein